MLISWIDAITRKRDSSILGHSVMFWNSTDDQECLPGSPAVFTSHEKPHAIGLGVPWFDRPREEGKRRLGAELGATAGDENAAGYSGETRIRNPALFCTPLFHPFRPLFALLRPLFHFLPPSSASTLSPYPYLLSVH